MLKLLLRRITLGLAAAAVAASAAAISVFAAGFGLYALLRHWLSAPAAGGATAAAFAVVALGISATMPLILKRRAPKPAEGLKIDAASLKAASEAGLALLAAAIELRGRRDGKGRDKVRRGKVRK